MLSAKSGDRLYISGFITDPKSREYTCPTCNEPVHHVKSAIRSNKFRVPEHFRHEKGMDVSHPERKLTAQRGEALDFLLSRLGRHDNYVIKTDRRLQSPSAGLDFVVDLLVKDKTEDEVTAIIVESGSFNANDHLAQHRYLTANNVNLMVVLCAKGFNNSSGRYLATERRYLSQEVVARLKPNELSMSERQNGRNVYFDHDMRRIRTVRFDRYTETRPDDFQLESGFTLKAGEQSFKSIKRMVVEGEFDDFSLEYFETNRGLYVAGPGPPLARESGTQGNLF